MPKVKKKPNVRKTKRLSKHYRGKAVTKPQQREFEKWVNKPKFNKTRPTEEQLLAECMNPKSKMFGLIEPNIKKAAANHWTTAAQELLRNVVEITIDVVTQEEIGEPVVAYFAPIRRQFGVIENKDYIAMRRLPDEPELELPIIERAYNDLLAWLRRYDKYTQLMTERDTVKELTKNMESAVRKLRRKVNSK